MEGKGRYRCVHKLNQYLFLQGVSERSKLTLFTLAQNTKINDEKLKDMYFYYYDIQVFTN